MEIGSVWNNKTGNDTAKHDQVAGIKPHIAQSAWNKTAIDSGFEVQGLKWSLNPELQPA